MPRKLGGSALRSQQTKTCPAPPAPRGNTRAATHGAKSATMLAPVRERHLQVLREDYPNLDGRRLVLLADRLARIDLASAWLDKQNGLVRNKQGEPYLIVREVEKWASRAEAILAEAEKENRRPKRVDLALEMSALDDG